MSTSARVQGPRQRTAIQVLVVDDHPIFRKGLVDLINDEPDMRVCGESESAIEALRACAVSNPDVAIIDLSLGQDSGLELVTAMLKARPALRVLVLSGHDERLYADRALKAGALGYVMKDRAGRDLLDSLRRVAAGKPSVSLETAERILATLVAARQPGETASPIGQLSNREQHVLTLVGRGLTTRQIAEQLDLSVKTVETHYARIKQKLGVRNGRELIRVAVNWTDRGPR